MIGYNCSGRVAILATTFFVLGEPLHVYMCILSHSTGTHVHLHTCIYICTEAVLCNEAATCISHRTTVMHVCYTAVCTSVGNRMVCMPCSLSTLHGLHTVRVKKTFPKTFGIVL